MLQEVEMRVVHEMCINALNIGAECVAGVFTVGSEDSKTLLYDPKILRSSEELSLKLVTSIYTKLIELGDTKPTISETYKFDKMKMVILGEPSPLGSLVIYVVAMCANLEDAEYIAKSGMQTLKEKVRDLEELKANIDNLMDTSLTELLSNYLRSDLVQ